MSTYALTHADRNIAELVNKARHTNQPVIITDCGTPAAAMISPQLLARYCALEDAADLAEIDQIRARGPRWIPDGEAQRLMDEAMAEAEAEDAIQR